MKNILYIYICNYTNHWTGIHYVVSCLCKGQMVEFKNGRRFCFALLFVLVASEAWPRRFSLTSRFSRTFKIRKNPQSRPQPSHRLIDFSIHHWQCMGKTAIRVKYCWACLTLWLCIKADSSGWDPYSRFPPDCNSFNNRPIWLAGAKWPDYITITGILFFIPKRSVLLGNGYRACWCGTGCSKLSVIRPQSNIITTSKKKKKSISMALPNHKLLLTHINECHCPWLLQILLVAWKKKHHINFYTMTIS